MFKTLTPSVKFRNFRYQKRCDELTVKNSHYSQQYDQMSTNQKEIVDFLNKSLEQKGRLFLWLCSFVNSDKYF